MGRDEVLIAAFADELRSRRAALRLSQEDLAHRAGINRSYVAKLELARNQPTLTVMLRVAEALETPLPELIAGALARRGKPSTSTQRPAVCSQCSHGGTSHPQSGRTVVAASELAFGGVGAAFGGAALGDCCTAWNAATSGTQRANRLRSGGSIKYQTLSFGSHRAPAAFAASFSANGTFRSTLIQTLRGRL